MCRKKLFTSAFTLFLMMFIWACSSLPIQIENFEGMSEIDKGGSALMKWKFINAEYVRVEGLNGYFNPTDSFRVSPDETKKYAITAYSGSDSVSNSWRVFVKDSQSGQPQRGPSGFYPLQMETSYDINEYLNGLMYYSNSAAPGKISVMRTIYPKDGSGHFQLRFMLMDEMGNHICGLGDKMPDDLAVEIDCLAGKKGLNPGNWEEKIFSDIDPGVNINILLENSASATPNPAIIDILKELTANLDPADNFALTMFNQKYHVEIPLSFSGKAAEQLMAMPVKPVSGLNAVYRAAFNSLVEQGKVVNGNENVMILFLYGPDNSSIIYELNDVANAARQLHIPVYVVGIGNNTDSYSGKYLSDFTGGKYFQVPTEDLASIKNILNQIVFSQKYYYEIKIPETEYYSNCNELDANIRFSVDANLLNTEKRLITRPERMFSKYQSLCAFDYKTDEPAGGYEINFDELAKVMKDNPSYMVQLTGHSDEEGSPKVKRELALKRVQKIRKKLLSRGIAPEQIRIVNASDSEPVYYFREFDWQKMYNRRVDIKWLDPELLPFEIIAGQSWTEENALDIVEKWESRGYSAYYQRYIHEDNPLYKIKIWGYKTLHDAELEADKLEKKYKVAMRIE